MSRRWGYRRERRADRADATIVMARERFREGVTFFDQKQYDKARAAFVRIAIEMIDAGGIEQRGPPPDAVDLIAFREQEFSQIRPILPGDPGHERLLHPFNSIFTAGPVARVIARFHAGDVRRP